jgi:hypothetical protein
MPPDGLDGVFGELYHFVSASVAELIGESAGQRAV